MRRVLILGAVLAASIGTARAQPAGCMAYMPQGVNGAAILCPRSGLDLGLTPEQFDYFRRRAEIFSARITRKDKECFPLHRVDGVCEERVERELPIPPITPEAMRFLARFGFTEETAR
jgi:hypothetical protein